MFVVLNEGSFTELERVLNEFINENPEFSYKFLNFQAESSGEYIVYLDEQDLDSQNPLDRIGEFKVVRARNRREMDEYEDELNKVDLTKGWKIEAYSIHGPLVIFSRSAKAKAEELGITSVKEYDAVHKAGCRNRQEYEKYLQFIKRVQKNFKEINEDADTALTDKRYGEFIRLKYLAFEKILEALVKQMRKDENSKVQDIGESLQHIRGRFNQAVADISELLKWRAVRNQIVHENLKPRPEQAKNAKRFFDDAIQTVLNMSTKVPWIFDDRKWRIFDIEEFPEPESEESLDEFDESVDQPNTYDDDE